MSPILTLLGSLALAHPPVTAPAASSPPSVSLRASGGYPFNGVAGAWRLGAWALGGQLRFAETKAAMVGPELGWSTPIHGPLFLELSMYLGRSFGFERVTPTWDAELEARVGLWLAPTWSACGGVGAHAFVGDDPLRRAILALGSLAVDWWVLPEVALGVEAGAVIGASGTRPRVQAHLSFAL